MKRPIDTDRPKRVRWVGSSKEDLSAFPAEVRRRIGGALWEAQIGRKASYAKPMRGFGGAGVLEVVDDFDGDTYRGLHRAIRIRGLCAARFSKEVHKGHCHAQG
jgi:phage-related protein